MLYIYGLGGHAKVIYEALGIWEQRGPWTVFVNDEHAGESFMGRPVRSSSSVKETDGVVIAIGDNLARRRVHSQLSAAGVWNFPDIGHETAIPAKKPDDQVLFSTSGRHFLARSFVSSHAEVGKFTIINTAATVDHDCEIGDFVHIAPGVNLCGNVRVGDNTLVGVGSVAIPGVRIGKDCVIGAGSVVVNDIPDGVVAFGNPCRVVKENHA